MSCLYHSLRLQNIQTVQSWVIIQHEYIIQIYLNVHYPESIQLKRCSIYNADWFNYGGILDRDDEDLHVSVFAVGFVDSVAEVGS